MLLDKGKNKKCFITGKKFSETKAKKHVETTLSQLLFILNLLTMPLCTKTSCKQDEKWRTPPIPQEI